MKKNIKVLSAFILSFFLGAYNVFAANVGDDFCSDDNVLRGFKIAGGILFVAKIFIPMIIIIISSVHMFKAVTSEDSKELKTQGKKLLITCIVGVCAFFIPTVILALVRSTGLVPSEYEDCSVCLLDVMECDVGSYDGGSGSSSSGSSSSSSSGSQCEQYNKIPDSASVRSACVGAGCSYDGSTGKCSD